MLAQSWDCSCHRTLTESTTNSSFLSQQQVAKRQDEGFRKLVIPRHPRDLSCRHGTDTHRHWLTGHHLTADTLCPVDTRSCGHRHNNAVSKAKCQNWCQIQWSPSLSAHFHPQLTVYVTGSFIDWPINIVCHSPPYFISVPKFYAKQVPAGSDKWHWSEKTMYIGFKNIHIVRKYKLVWIRSELNQTYGLWLCDRESTS